MAQSGQSPRRPADAPEPPAGPNRCRCVALRKKPFLLIALTVLVAGAVLLYKGVRRLTKTQWSDRKLEAAFADGTHGEATVGYLDGTSRRLRFVQVGEDPNKPTIAFIHGSPSSSAFWIKMLRDSALQSRANLLAIDRPGYGGSDRGRAMISVEEQAANVAQVIRNRRPSRDQKLILHGSSYGGTVSARIAMDYPEEVDGLLLQSASMAPLEEFTYWISHPTNHWSLRWLMPRAIRTVNMEKINHQAQLEYMADRWDNITARTVIAHGTDDWLIYPPNAYFACDRLTNAEELIHHMVDGAKHDLIHTAPDLLRYYLHYLLDDYPEKAHP